MCLLTERKMSIKQLRRDLPGWEWKAKQAGFGSWVYLGKKRAMTLVEGSTEELEVTFPKTVRVHAVACVCGPSGDEFATDWLVDDGSTSMDYSSWWLEMDAERCS